MTANMPILQIQGLHVSFEKNQALAGIDLEVQQGESIALLGPNGGGKTTLLKAILGLQQADRGSIRILGQRPRAQSLRLLGYVPQKNSFSSDYPVTVRELVLTAFVDSMRPLRKVSAKQEEMAHGLLRSFGLLDLLRSPVSSLSGGELQRLLIVRALATEPRLLLLDEPMAHLDTENRELLYGILKQRPRDTAFLMATHDTEALSQHFSRVVFLNQGILFLGPPKKARQALRQFSKRWIF